MSFTPFPKIPRLNREIIVTEKIDGTNASIFIHDPLENVNAEEGFTSARDADGRVWNIKAGSRKRWIAPNDDNHGFAKWVWANADELVKLGPGHHFGEWWGQGIQRGYGMDHKAFSLFNTHRWSDDNGRPGCCSVVPALYQGNFNSDDIEMTLQDLQEGGSYAAPGFMEPEGIIVYHTAANSYFKVTLANDDHKGYAPSVPAAK